MDTNSVVIIGKTIDASSCSQKFIFENYYLPYVISPKIGDIKLVDASAEERGVVAINFRNDTNVVGAVNFWEYINE